MLFSSLAYSQTEPVKLRWVNIPGAKSYDLEVESSGSSGRALVNRNVEIPEVSLELPPGSYMYRVRGVAGKGKGPWSEKQPFEVKPETIALLSPATDLKIEAGAKIRLSWKATSGHRYRVQVLDNKGTVVSDRETTDSFFNWTAPGAGVFQWRVTYANITDATWSEKRIVRAHGSRRYSAGLITGTRVEKPSSRWAKSIWAGANMNAYEGDFADTGNNVQASTLSANYAFKLERKHERFSPYSEPRPSATLGLKQQSLVKEVAWLPELNANYAHLWTLGYMKIGPTVNAGYGRAGFFTADATGSYKTSAFWRGTYGVGLYAEYLFSNVVLSAFGRFAMATGGDSSLASGGIDPSNIIEAGIGGKLVRASRWTMQLRFYNEEVKWTSSIGANSLTSNNVSLDFGGEL